MVHRDGESILMMSVRGNFFFYEAVDFEFFEQVKFFFTENPENLGYMSLFNITGEVYPQLVHLFNANF